MVHLVFPPDSHTLCGEPVRYADQRPSFRTAGCRACLRSALEASRNVAQDGDRVWINLTRVPPAPSGADQGETQQDHMH